MLPYIDQAAYTYVLADVRGYGQSRGITGQYTAKEIAGDVSALADSLGLESLHLVGHSMTGLAVQRALVDYPDRLLSASLVSPVIASGYPADADTKAFMWASIEDKPTTREAMAALTGGRLNASWARLRAQNFASKTDKDAVRGYYHMWLEGDFHEEVRRAAPSTPTLVLGGKHDLPGFDEATYANTLAKWMSHYRFELLEDAGHYSMLESPIRVASMLEQHHSLATKPQDTKQPGS